MLGTSESLQVLVDEFSKLPQIGRKTALRLAMYLIRQPRIEVERFSKALLEIKDRIRFCKICCNITEDEICRICVSEQRTKNIICVVEEPQDVIALEKTNEFKGLYHVLHGIISPLDGIGPNEIRIRELLVRLEKGNGASVDELILALNPTVEGETTILYLSRLLKPFEIKITRIARGIPVGSDLEFADEVTLAKALEARVLV